MTFQPTPTMNSLDAMFDELFGPKPKLMPNADPPAGPELTPEDFAAGDECAERG